MTSTNRLYWLASFPKSGNTWVRMLINACKTGTMDINVNYNNTSYDCDVYLYNALAPRPLNQMDKMHMAYLRPAVLLHLLAKTTALPVIVKSHNARIRAGGIDMVPQYLTAGAVYLVRDPRDVAISFARHTGQTIDQAISEMNEPESMLTSPNSPVHSWLTTWTRHVNSWDCPDVVRVRYEDLKADTEKEFRRILEGFKIKFPAQRIKKAIRLCNIENLKKQESKERFIEKGKADKFFGQGSGWKNVLTENQVRKIEMDHGETMEKLGYELEFL